MAVTKNLPRFERLVRTSAMLLLLIFAIPRVHAFEFAPHRDITRRGLDRVAYAFRDDFLKFHERAVDHMVPRVQNVDWDTAFGLAPGTAKYHCDADLLSECARHVEQQIDTLVNGLLAENEGDGLFGQEVYWEIFAATLHTVQDFYTHTNWVEINGAHDFANFGERGDLAFAPSTLGGPDGPCPTGNGTTIVPGMSRLGSGFYPIPSPLGLIDGQCAHGPFLNFIGISKDSSGRPNYGSAFNTAVNATFMLAMKVLIRLEQAEAYGSMCLFLGHPKYRCEGPESMSGTFSASGSSYIGYAGGCTAPMAWSGHVVIYALDTANPELVFTGSRTFGPECLDQVDPMGPWSVFLTRNGQTLTGNTGSSSDADTISWNLTIAESGGSISGTFFDQHYYVCCGSYAAGSASGTATLNGPED